MRSADEVAFVDAVHGTYLYAFAATCAERIVDGSEVVLDGNSASLTGLLTLHTADTTVGAVFAHGCALVLV